MHDLAFINGRVYINDTFHNTNVYIKDGRISALTPSILNAVTTYDCNQNMVLPGIIDPHTHMDLDLGHISSIDDFEDGTIAAAFGGVTTIVDFLEPVDTVEDLHKAFHKRYEQAANAVIDVKFHACFKDPKDNLDAMTSTMMQYGMNTVKIFTTYSESNRRTYDKDIIRLLELSKTKNFTLACHIEHDEMIELDEVSPYALLPDNRPTKSETSEALKLAQFAMDTGGVLYMVHCSSGDTIKALKEQFDSILHKNFIVETCPHYVSFDRQVLLQPNGYLYTMAPPLRSKEEQRTLINHIDDIDTIGTDHCTFLSTDKDKKLLKDIPLGVGGVEQSFQIMHTLFGDSIIPKMTSNVAKVHQLYPQKGVIQVGSDADLFIYDNTETLLDRFHGKCDYCLYQGMTVSGQIVSTISRGQFVVKDNELMTHTGTILHPRRIDNDNH